jgi:hypothetical protein
MIILIYRCFGQSKVLFVSLKEKFKNFYFNYSYIYSDQLENLLSSTSVHKSVKFDLENMKNEFEKVVKPFVQKNIEKFK